MQENSWRESDSFNELEPLSSLLADLSQLTESDDETAQPPQKDYRRRKAAVILIVIWSSTIALHLVTWGYWLVLGLTTLMGVHAVRLLLARPVSLPPPLLDGELATAPRVSLMVAAKNEEAVIGRLVKLLCNLDYPHDRYEVWAIDDDSSDRTATILAELAKQYPQLRVVRRAANAPGGKSGALNQVLPLTQGDIIAVFDADAQVPADLLRRVVPLFRRESLGAVQVRKAVSNVSSNFWIRGQVAEMALDTYIQQQRIRLGGIGELRGNGQFVRRAALEACGGWNEETITDDLDLTIRLHLNRWDIDVTLMPAVQEEGVVKAIALWHQRNRWAEGGYQRYLDYWRPILSNRMGTRKTIDLGLFWLTQYFLPSAAIPDALMALIRHQPMVWAPVGGLTVQLSLLGMVFGLRRIHRQEHALQRLSEAPVDASPRRSLRRQITLFLQALLGTLYMFHWCPVVASTALRMSVRPKRLKWVKTAHHGESAFQLNLPQ